MAKSIILTFAAAAGLVSKESTVSDINGIVFKTVIVPSTRNLTKDGDKYYQVDAVKNTAVEFTPDAIKAGAVKALDKNKDTDGYLATAEDCGLVTSLSFVRGENAGTGNSNITSLAKALDLKVASITVDTQNSIIFRKEGLAQINDLVEDAGKYYTMDVAKNTATLVDAKAMAASAKKDIVAGKDTDASRLAQAFNLVSAVTFVTKD